MTDFLDRTIDNLRGGPLGPVIKIADTYPRLSAWFVLALGMVILLVIEARDVGLLPGQWVSLIIATILVAGACIWIISFEDEDDTEDDVVAAPAEAKATEAESDDEPEAADNDGEDTEDSDKA